MKGLIFTYVLTYGGALVACFNPYVGFLIYVAFAIIRPESLWHWAVPAGGNYSRIVAGGLLLGWVVQGFGKWNLGRAKPIVAFLLAYWVWSAVSAPHAVADTSRAWDQFWEYAKIVLPFLVAITTVREVRQVKQLAWVLALCQGYLALEFNRIYYASSGGFDPDEWNFAGLDRNGIAITMVTSAGLTFFLGLYSSKLWQKLLCLGMAALMVHVVLFSLSRGGMLSLIVTAATIVVLIPKKPAYVAVAVLALIVGMRLAGPEVMNRFATVLESEDKRDASAQSRLDLWGTCVKIMLKHPIAGIGSNNWRLVSHEYGFPPGKDAHTMWLHVGAEMGFTGLFFLLGFYGTSLVKSWRLRRQTSLDVDPWLLRCPDMVITGIVGFAVSAQFVSVYAVEIPFYVVLVGASALKLASQPAERETFVRHDAPEQIADPAPAASVT